jgi:hypothetical protein
MVFGGSRLGWGVAAMDVEVAGRQTQLLEVLSEDEEVPVYEPPLGVKVSRGSEVLWVETGLGLQ